MKRCDWILRSMMFVPGHNHKLIKKALMSDADALIVDLEDSVPLREKRIAKEIISTYASQGAFSTCDKKVFVRVNGRGTDLFLADLETVVLLGIDGIMMPKVYRAEDIYFIDHLLEAIERSNHIEIGKTKVVVLIETAAAVLNVQGICRASERIIAVAFGCEDFIADLEAYHDLEHESIYIPRALIALGARASGVIPIDTVHIDVHNLDDLEMMLIKGRKFGFEGQLVLHPKEIPLVHQYYTPGKTEVDEAREMLNLYEKALKENKGVAVYDGKFIGPPMVVAAHKILERNQRISPIEDWFPGTV